MPLQIRRGTDLQRTSMTQPLAVGELLFVTSPTNRIYVGDGTTLGGIAVTGYTDENAQDAVAPMFTGGSHSGINFVYNDASNIINATVDLSNYNGTISASSFKGTLVADDSTALVDAVDGRIFLDGTVKGNIVPDADVAYDLGSATYRFRDLYLSGSSIELGAATITAVGSAVNLPLGSTMGGVPLAGGAGSDYNGNIIGDDSTIIVNAATKAVTAAGGFTGNLTGNATSVTNGVYITDTGTVTNTMLAGSIADTKLSTISTAGKVSNSATTATNANTASAIVSRDGSGNFLANVITSNLIGNVTGNVTGDVVGNLYGDVKGSVFAEDSAVMVDATSGNINAGLLTVTTKINVDNIEAAGISGLNVRSDGTTPLSITGIGTLGASSGQVYFNINAAKGTLAAPTTTTGGDGLGGISIQGYDGTGYKTASLIVGNWDASATLVDTFPKSILKLITGGGGSTLRQASLDSLGVFTAPVQQTTVYSVAGTALPSASTVGNGARAFVSDATATTFASAYTGGGANNVPVYSDGSVWRIG